MMSWNKERTSKTTEVSHLEKLANCFFFFSSQVLFTSKQTRDSWKKNPEIFFCRAIFSLSLANDSVFLWIHKWIENEQALGDGLRRDWVNHSSILSRSFFIRNLYFFRDEASKTHATTKRRKKLRRAISIQVSCIRALAIFIHNVKGSDKLKFDEKILNVGKS